MASTAALSIIVKAKDDASKTLMGIDKTLGGLAKAAGGLMLVGGAALGAVAVGALKLATDAAALEPTRVTFDNLTESIGSTAASMLDKLRPATMGVVADADLMQAANKLMAMGLAETEEEAAKLSEMAVTLGTAMGENATASMENFALMLANQSIPRLDSFGISSGKVRERILELMQANKDLTREQAFLTATMEAGEVAMQKVGDVSGTTGVEVQQIQTTFKNITDEVGSAFIPILAKLLEPLGKLAEEYGPKVTAWAEEFASWITDKLIPAIQTVAGFIKDNWIPILGGLASVIMVVGVPALVAWAAGATAAAAATIVAMAPIIAIIAPIAAVGVAVGLLVKHIKDNKQAHEELAAEAIHTSSTYTEYRQAVEDSDRWTTTLSEDVWKLVDAKIELQNATGEAAEALAAEGIEQQKLLDTMQKASELQHGAVNRLSAVIIARGEAAKALVLQDAELRTVALTMGLLTETEVDLVEGLEASDRAMLLSAENTQELREQTGYYTEALGTATEVMGEAVIASQGIIEAQGAVGSAAAEAALNLEIESEAIRETEPAIEDMIAHLKKLAQDPSIREHADQVRAMAQTVREAMREATISYATFFGDVSEGVEEHKAKLLEIEETSAADLEAAWSEHADSIQGLQAEYSQAETDEQREHLDAKIAEENEAFAELETKQTEHLATKLAKEEEAYAELQETQRKQLGQMLMQQIDVWARIDDTVAEHALEMKLTVAEEFGIITETGRQQAEDMLGFMEEWRAGGAEKTDDMIAKFQEYMDKAQDGVTATENFGSAIDSIPEIDIRHNLVEIEDKANRATAAVNSIPSHKNVKVHFERTGWSGVQEMSPKTRIQYMLEDLDTFLQRTDFTVNFGATGQESIEFSMASMGETITQDTALMGETVRSGTASLHRWLDNAWSDNNESIRLGTASLARWVDNAWSDVGEAVSWSMASVGETVSQGMASVGEIVRQDTISLHRWLDNAWADVAESISQSMASIGWVDNPRGQWVDNPRGRWTDNPSASWADNPPMPGYQFGGGAPGPSRTGRDGPIHIEIHNLYGTDREAAEKLSKHIAAQLRRDGVI